MKRFQVIEVDPNYVAVEDTHADKDKYGHRSTSIYFMDFPPFEVGDWVDIVIKLQERPEAKT
jgi:hypothetical protein